MKNGEYSLEALKCEACCRDLEYRNRPDAAGEYEVEKAGVLYPCVALCPVCLLLLGETVGDDGPARGGYYPELKQ